MISGVSLSERSEMSAPLEIKPETADMLAEQARAQGLSVDEYLKTLLGLANGKQNPPELAIEEFMAAMESLAEEGVQPLPRNFSREDV